MREEDPDDLPNVCADCFHDSDLARFLHRHRDERVHNPERGHDHDEEQQEKHDRALKPHRFEKLAIHVDPGLRGLRRLEKFLDRLLHAIGRVGIDRPHRDPMQRILEPIKFLSHMHRHEEELGVVQVMAGFVNAGHG